MMKTKIILALLQCLVYSIGFANSSIVHLPNTASDFKYTKKKTINANFDAGKEYTLNLSGNFSSYDIKTWDEDYIGFHVEIIAKSVTEKIAEELLHDIDVEFKNSKANNTIYAKTVINSRRHKNIYLSISYYIMIPKDLYLIINSSYGDVTIDKLTRDFILDLDFADLTIDSLMAYSNLDVSYGDTKIKYATKMDADIDFGGIRLKTINDLNVKINYGDCNIGNVKTLKADCDFSDFSCSYAEAAIVDVNYSDAHFDEVEEVKINNSFSDVEVDYLIKKITINSNYGDIEINKVNSDFELIDIHSKFADTEIHLNENQSLSYDIKISHGSITNNIFKEKANRYIKEDDKITAIGNINDNDKLHNIKIDALYGDVEIDFE